MTVVIKIGGAAIEEPGILRVCAEAVAQLVRQGHRVAIIHGGGKTLSRTLKQLGIKTEFVDGLRVTDAATRDVALMVLAGLVNKKLVGAIQAAGVSALGLCGGDGKMFRARKKEAGARDLGFVGEIDNVDLQWLEAIWSRGGVPVLASVAIGEDGEYYNVNADEMASACAAACRAGTLVFLTDVAGVKDASGRVIPSLSTDEIAALAANSVIGGGMLPKLRACADAVLRGVTRVRILAASHAELLPRLDVIEEAVGTEVTHGDFHPVDAMKEGVRFEYSTAK
ncbi:MAG: acetylglutamate kinase [Candidatus Sulfotelmatobacter sp.]